MARSQSRRYRPSLVALESREVPTVLGVHRGPRNLGQAAQVLASQTPPPAPTPPVPVISPGPGQPLPSELARTRFSASFTGPVQANRARYSGQSAILSFRGIGTSTEFLHGDYQMAIVLPAAHSGDITGGAFLQDRNISGGNQIGLDINFSKTLDKKGRPTLGTWVTDPNIYSGANYFNQGSGTIQIKYAKSGVATVIFRGHIYTNGITDILANASKY